MEKKLLSLWPRISDGPCTIGHPKFFLENWNKLHSGVWIKTQVHANFFHICTSFDHASRVEKICTFCCFGLKPQIYAALEAWSNEVRMWKKLVCTWVLNQTPQWSLFQFSKKNLGWPNGQVRDKKLVHLLHLFQTIKDCYEKNGTFGSSLYFDRYNLV